MIALKKIKSVELHDRQCCLKNNWWEYDCEVEYEDGTSGYGTIQSDGHSHSLESFEPE